MKTNGDITLGTQYGDRTQMIIAANVDGVRNRTSLHELDIRMDHMDVDIVCIQEAHQTQSLDMHTQGYRYISYAAKSTQCA